MLKLHFLIFLFTFYALCISAQPSLKIISGFVVDYKNEKIEGASVYLNSNLNTVTNVDGYFEIKTYVTDTIKIYALNYDIWSCLVSKLAKNNIKIQLKNRIIELEEVTVTDNTTLIIDSILKKAFKKLQNNIPSVEAFLRQWLIVDDKYITVSESLIKVNLPSYYLITKTNKTKIFLLNNCILKDSLTYRYHIATDVRKIIERGQKNINLFNEILKSKYNSKIIELGNTTEIELSNDIYVLKFILNKNECNLMRFYIEKKSLIPFYKISYDIFYAQKDEVTVMLKLKFLDYGIKKNIAFKIGEELYFNYKNMSKENTLGFNDNFKFNDLKYYKSKIEDCSIIKKYKNDFNIPSFIYDN